MKHFRNINDVADVRALVREAMYCKQHPNAYRRRGRGKTLGLIFMNPSLRTRLSTQKAGRNLGMDVQVMNFSSEGWALEMEDGAVMDGNKAEHIREAAAVVGTYCDIVGIRSFPSLQDRAQDYADRVINAFVQYAGIPVVNLESATVHPCQSLADMLTIEETKKKARPKVLLTWAPHPRALPQSVANSFAEWVHAMDYELVLGHPEAYELSEAYAKDAKVVHSPEEAYAGVDYVYAKNWSSYESYGKVLTKDPAWMVSKQLMDKTNDARFMHCLPVRRNVVVSDEVIDSPNSLVIRTAANREFSAQAVLKQILHHG